jgi:hypothetical protein
VWADDATTSGATISSLQELDDQLVILPKLFRRLVDYFALSAGDVALDGFMAFLASRDDRLFVISEAYARGWTTSLVSTARPSGCCIHPTISSSSKPEFSQRSLATRQPRARSRDSVAIPLAIRSLSQRRSRCHCPDGAYDLSCGDTPRHHQADGWCLTSNPWSPDQPSWS